MHIEPKYETKIIVRSDAKKKKKIEISVMKFIDWTLNRQNKNRFH